MRGVVRLVVVLAIALGALPAGVATQAQAASPKFSVSPSQPMVAEQFTITGKVKTKVVRSVSLQRKSGKKWITFAKAKTSKTGSFAIKATVSRTTVVRVVAPKAKVKSKRYAAIVFSSRTLTIVSQKATVSLVATAVVGSRLSAGLAFSPARTGRPVLVQRLTASGWTTVVSGTQSSSGTARLAFTASSTGTVSYRGYAPAWHGAAAVASAAVSVTQAYPSVAISTASLPAGRYGRAYSAQLAATGGNGSYSWSATGLPVGVNIDSATGALSGAPSVAGSFSVTVTATDGLGQTASRDFTVAVAEVATALGAGVSHTCAVTATGKVQCWGWNEYGQLGRTAEAKAFAPAEVPGLSEVVEVAGGRSFSCARTSAGAVWCWGANHRGQLGNNSTTDSVTPVQAQLQGAGGAQQLVVGADSACVLDSSGGVQCWGYNINGQLGTGDVTDSLVPVYVSGLINGVSAISSASSFSCAVATPGSVKCWGVNGWGQLGNGEVGSWSTIPVQVSTLSSGVSDVAVGVSHACALKAGGAFNCWGHQDAGAFGDGSTDDRGHVPGTWTGSGYTVLKAGNYHTCGLTDAGVVNCWGRNASGVIGQPVDWDHLGYNTPTEIAGLGGSVSAITSGANHACALVDGAVKCWGDNSSGQAGGSETIEVSPIGVPGLS